MLQPGTAPRFHRATAALATAAVLAVGSLAFFVGSVTGAVPVKKKTSSLTIAGTAVTPDGRTPVPRARITIMPESTVTFTDIDGDFLASWNGREGWITVVPEDRTRDGKEWCKRIVLRAKPAETEGPIFDLGLVTIMPRAQVLYRQTPTAPPGYPQPPLLHVAGPKSGEPDTCRMQVSYATDIWGRVTRVDVAGTDPPPSQLKNAIMGWIRSVPWSVAAETPCDSAEPFKAIDVMNYAWADSAWVLLPGAESRSQPKPPPIRSAPGR
jgi:hypothetical protein